LSKLDRIGELLKVQSETFPQKELSSAEIARWEQDLQSYPIQAIEYAFEEHRTLAMFFPVPAQILDICKTWEPPQAYKPGCNPECKERHGKGYNENDVLSFWNLFNAKRASVGNRPLNEVEIGCLLDALDKKRGHSPEWRG
jgi:hypothetical protein